MGQEQYGKKLKEYGVVVVVVASKSEVGEALTSMTDGEGQSLYAYLICARVLYVRERETVNAVTSSHSPTATPTLRSDVTLIIVG